ncbi:hypothetical protein B0H14DRAFT_2831383 [Mycena olivaceomarginata]|nr:hypothetical protein B0H14DRAFT_2831383 [Mycena olivaceomarginata]
MQKGTWLRRSIPSRPSRTLSPFSPSSAHSTMYLIVPLQSVFSARPVSCCRRRTAGDLGGGEGARAGAGGGGGPGSRKTPSPGTAPQDRELGSGGGEASMIEAAHIPRARWYYLRHTVSSDKFDDGEGEVVEHGECLSFFPFSRQARRTLPFHFTGARLC